MFSHGTEISPPCVYPEAALGGAESPALSCFSPSFTCCRKSMRQKRPGGRPRISFTMCKQWMLHSEGFYSKGCHKLYCSETMIVSTLGTHLSFVFRQQNTKQVRRSNGYSCWMCSPAFPGDLLCNYHPCPERWPYVEHRSAAPLSKTSRT